jgi:hypothetical protein
MTAQTYEDFNVSDGLPQPSLRFGILKMVELPQVCSLAHNNNMVVKVLCTATN